MRQYARRPQPNASFGCRILDRTANTNRIRPKKVATLATEIPIIIRPLRRRDSALRTRSWLLRLTTLILSLRQNLKLNCPSPGPSLVRRWFRRRWRHRNNWPTARETKVSESLRARRLLIIRILRTSLRPSLASALALFLGVRRYLTPHA